MVPIVDAVPTRTICLPQLVLMAKPTVKFTLKTLSTARDSAKTVLHVAHRSKWECEPPKMYSSVTSRTYVSAVFCEPSELQDGI
jgi:hypothetical protein